MPEDAARPHAVVFMSYRRDDTRWAARGIYEELSARYGRDKVFRDLDAIPLGVRFRDFVQRKISESNVFILLIGKSWSSLEARRLLEMASDPVRQEIEAALQAECLSSQCESTARRCLKNKT